MNSLKDEDLVRTATHDWAKAIAEKNADKAAEFFADDVVSFELAPPLKHIGFDRRLLNGWFATWDGMINYDITDQVVEVSDRLAISRSIDHMVGKRNDGQLVDIWTRSTVCFRKENDTRKVIHLHSSVPFYMDGSLKAAVDLKP